MPDQRFAGKTAVVAGVARGIGAATAARLAAEGARVPLVDLQRLIGINLRAAISLTRDLAPRLRRTGGRIVNVSSIFGLTGYRGTVGYAVSGRPSRVALLRELIAVIRNFPDVWFATGTEIAEAWIAAGEPEVG